VLGGSLHRPPGSGEVTADLHDPAYADARGEGDRLGRLQPFAVGDVEVSVVVDDRLRERLGCVGTLAVAAGAVLGGRRALADRAAHCLCTAS
jgi:hypothetical protein